MEENNLNNNLDNQNLNTSEVNSTPVVETPTPVETSINSVEPTPVEAPTPIVEETSINDVAPTPVTTSVESTPVVEPIVEPIVEQPATLTPEPTPTPVVEEQPKEPKKSNLLLIIIIALVVIGGIVAVVIINPFSSSGNGGGPAIVENKDVKSVESVLKAFVTYLKNGEKDKAISLIYNSSEKNTYIDKEYIEFQRVVDSVSDFEGATYEYEESETEPFEVSMSNSEIDFKVIKSNGNYYIYNFSTSKYSFKSALITNKRVAVISGTEVTVNGEDSSKYKTETVDFDQRILSGMVSGDMYVKIPVKVDIYEMKVGTSFNIRTKDGQKLVENREIDFYTTPDEKYKNLTFEYVEPTDTSAKEYATELLKNIFLNGYNQKDFSTLNMKFNNSEDETKFKKGYDTLKKNAKETYTGTFNGKVTIKSLEITNTKVDKYLLIGENRWLVQVEYKLSMIRDIEYAPGLIKKSVYNEEKTREYDPVIIIEKKGNDYYIEYISSYIQIFDGYYG